MLVLLHAARRRQPFHGLAAGQVNMENVVSRRGADPTTLPCGRRGPGHGAPRQHLPCKGKGLTVPGTERGAQRSGEPSETDPKRKAL